MSFILCLAVALSADGVESPAAVSLSGSTVVASDAPPPEDVSRIAIPPQRTADELRKAVHATLKETAPWLKKDPARAADALLPLFVELKLDKELVKEDRDQYTTTVRARLIKIKDQIVADEKKAHKNAAKKLAVRPAGPLQPADDKQAPPAAAPKPALSPAAAGGMGVQDGGKELVELIQKTIAPDSWDVNGGNGVIIYFEPLHVLVIRQTDEVHEAIGGGLLRGLRQAQQ